MSRALTAEERASWDTAHAALCQRGDATCSAHQRGNWWHLTYDALAALAVADAIPYSRPVAPVGGETAAPQNGGSTPPSGGTGLATPMTCPVCGGAGIVDTSPPGVEGSAP